MHNGILYLAGQSLKELMLPIIGSELIVNLIMMVLLMILLVLMKFILILKHISEVVV